MTPLARRLRAVRRALLRAQFLALLRPRLTLALFTLLLAGLAWQVPRMRVLLSIADLHERALPSGASNAEAHAAFGLGQPLFLVFAPGPAGVFSGAELERLRDWLEEETFDNPDLLRLASPFSVQRVKAAWPAFRSVPLVERPEPEALRALAGTPWGGMLTDPEGRDVAVELVLRDAPAGNRFGTFPARAVQALLERCRARVLQGTDVRLHVVGTAGFNHAALDGVRRFRRLNLAILALLLLLFRALFGTWRSGLLLVGVLAAAGLFVYGAMSLAGAPIDLLSTGLFLMLSVAAIEDWLFVCARQLREGVAWRRGLRSLLAPGFFTSLTTLLGFGSLLVSDLAVVRRFGAWAAFGAAVEWGVTFLVLPACLAVFPRLRTWTDPARALWPAPSTRPARAPLPAAAALALVAVYPAAALAAFHLNGDDAPARLFPRDNPYRQALDYLSASRGWVAEVSVVFPAHTRREDVQATLAQIGRDPNVARVADPYESVGFAAGDLASRDVDVALLRERLAGSSQLASLFSADGRARASLYLRDVSLRPLEQTLAAVARACRVRGCRAAGDLVAYAEFQGQVPGTLFRSFASCLLLVGAVLVGLTWALGQRGAWAVVASAFWGPAVMVVVLWALQVPLTFLTCVFASALVGLTGDNPIQCLFAARRDGLLAGVERRGGAALQVALVMGLAALVFVGSSFVPSRRLGALLALGFAAAVVGDLWLLRALLSVRPRLTRG